MSANKDSFALGCSCGRNTLALARVSMLIPSSLSGRPVGSDEVGSSDCWNCIGDGYVIALAEFVAERQTSMRGPYEESESKIDIDI
jgi:hypothetical protein